MLGVGAVLLLRKDHAKSAAAEPAAFSPGIQLIFIEISQLTMPLSAVLCRAMGVGVGAYVDEDIGVGAGRG